MNTYIFCNVVMAELDIMHKHFTKYVRNVIIKGTKLCVVA